MEGEQSGQNEENKASPKPTAGSTPDGNYGKDVYKQQASISEQAFVDRVNISDRWMIFLTCAIVATGIISAIIFYWQLGTMQGQLNEMRDEQRPWLKVTPKIAGPLTNDRGSLSIKIVVDMVNIGHTPAANIRAKSEIVKVPGAIKPDWAQQLLDMLCKSPQEALWEFPYFGGNADIIFPSEPESLDTKAVDSTAENGIVVNIPGDGNVSPINIRNYPDICVAYSSIGSGVVHHTGGTTSITLPEGMDVIEDGQRIPGAL